MKSTKIALAGVMIVALLVGFFLLRKNPTEQLVQKQQSLTPMTLAMDYTPNTNHTGVYVALAKGFYKEEGIDLKILPYSSAVLPDLLVATDKADVGISYTEGVVSDAAAGHPVVSIGAIIQHNTSSLVALPESGITTPKDLEGKTYGGWGAPYEKAVISEMIKRAGGTGNFTSVSLDIDGITALQTGKIDFMWIFDGWTGVEAKRKGVKFVSFPINANGIPDYYTPVFVTAERQMKKKPELLKKFMKATKQGYEYAIAHPKESAQILIDSTPKGTFPDKELVFASQEYLSPRYVDKGRSWGLQDKAAWHDYPQFMLESDAILDNKGKVVKSLDFDSLYTNEFLE